MDRILSRFIFFLLYVFSSFFLSFSLLSQIFISSFPLRISSPLSYSVVQGVVSSLFIPSSFFSVLLWSSPLRWCKAVWQKLICSLSPRVERRRIMERTTKSLKLASVRLLSTHRYHNHHRGAHPHHYLLIQHTFHHH